MNQNYQQIKFCKKCLYSSTHPLGLTINKDGICSGCLVHEEKDIINSIYMQIGFSKKISENLFDDILDVIVENLIKYKKLKITNFGTFSIKEKKSRPGYNFKTKEIR